MRRSPGGKGGHSTEGTEKTAAPAGRGVGDRPRGGLLEWPYPKFLLLAAFIAQVLSILVFSNASLILLGFILPIFLPALILCPLALSKGRPWMFLGAGVTLAVLPVLVVAFGPDTLVRPALGPPFVASMLLMLSLTLGLPAGVAGFRGAKSSVASLTARQGLRTRAGLLAVAVGGLFVGAILAGEAAYLGATSTTPSNNADLAAEVNVTITAENFAFVPTNVTLPSGRLVEVTVVNRDNQLHTFTYTVDAGTSSAHTYSPDLLPSSTLKFTTFFRAPRTVHFWCVPHAPGMSGDFTVT